MTREELDTKITRIEHDQNVSPEEKQARISRLNEFFVKAQKQESDAKLALQQDAEARLKSALKTAYMKNEAATLEDFERDYPQLKSDYLRIEAMKADATVKSAQARMIQESF